LACSGELYNRRVETSDWRKSDLARLLLEQPFRLLVASQPFESYPQELCTRLTLARVTEESRVGDVVSSITFLPDKDIIEDICALLTFLSRRLISPVVKTMETLSDGMHGPWQSHVSTPIIDRFKVTAWPRRSVTITTSLSGQTIEFNQPPPVGVDHEALADFFAHLAAREDAKDIVYAAHQYKTALELIEERPDTAYLALVSVVETFASLALPAYEPEDSEKLEIKGNVVKRARKLGLCEGQANEIAIEATKGDRWLARKFVKFCKEYCLWSELEAPDSVFMIPKFLMPAEGDFEDCLKRIYRVRSKNLHVAVPFPPGVGIGTTPSLNIRDLPSGPLGKLEVPPATWFERVVSTASRRYLLGGLKAPFVEYG